MLSCGQLPQNTAALVLISGLANNITIECNSRIRGQHDVVRITRRNLPGRDPRLGSSQAADVIDRVLSVAPGFVDIYRMYNEFDPDLV